MTVAVEDRKYPTWYIIPGIKGYLVNKKGLMLRTSDGFITKGSYDGRYYKVSFHDPINLPPKAYMHRLVAAAFLGINEDPDIIVNHKDGNKLNNHYTNLEYITISENLKHAYKLGLKKPTTKVVLESYFLRW